MNILVTDQCNRRECTFCFEQSVPALKAAGTRASARPANFIALDDYRALIRRAAGAWHSPRVSLLGGEPTQHPLIALFVDEALALGLQVVVLTNGVIGRVRGGELAALQRSRAGRRLFFLVNPYLRPEQPLRERAAIHESLAWMGSAATLALSVTGPDVELEALADLIDRFALNRLIRVSLAHPLADAPNAYADRDELHHIGRVLKAKGRVLLARDIRLLCDCGFVACMFADDPRAGEAPAAAIRRGTAALAESGILFRSVCHPLLDVHPDLTVSHCLPLASRERLSLREVPEEPRQRLADRLGGRIRATVQAYLFDACRACELRESGECVAGCLAHRLKLQASEPRCNG
jgi:hypothetical protein